MIETVLVMPFIMIALMLIVYLGWNFRRIAQVTNMDRYAAWEQVTPGAPGPNMQGLEQEIRNPKLNEAFYSLNGDQALELDELGGGDNNFLPEGHRELRDQQTDEEYSYYEEFLELNPRGVRERFTSKHAQSVNTELLDLSDFARNERGHSRMNGDWRYLNGIEYNDTKSKWEPANRRVAPGSSLREIFFVEMDEGLEAFAEQNTYASGVRNFYLAYPPYRGPEIDPDNDSSSSGGVSGF